MKTHLALLALNALGLVITVPTNVNIVVTALLTIYAGCWRSVKEEGAEQVQEQMTKRDALRFPIVGSAVLFGLFLSFKFLPKELVNTLLSVYLGFIACFVLKEAVEPYLRDYFPESVRRVKYTLPKFRIPYLLDGDEAISFTVPEAVVFAASCGFCLWYFMRRHWLANNVLGLAFSLEGIEHLSLGSVQVGGILLVGLFFYDIFWVFCTPVMVSVAKNFDAPIKLLFPRVAPPGHVGKRPFSMLGLGDIVIPGLFVALFLRYDVDNNFRTSYFQAAFAGYTVGLSTTIVVMNVFQAAQPALLYIVPGLLGAVSAYAAYRGELAKMFNYEEGTPVEAEADGAAAAKKKKKAVTSGGKAAAAAGAIEAKKSR